MSVWLGVDMIGEWETWFTNQEIGGQMLIVTQIVKVVEARASCAVNIWTWWILSFHVAALNTSKTFWPQTSLSVCSDKGFFCGQSISYCSSLLHEISNQTISNCRNCRSLWYGCPAVPPRTGTLPQGRNRRATFSSIALPEDLSCHAEGQLGCCVGHNQWQSHWLQCFQCLILYFYDLHVSTIISASVFVLWLSVVLVFAF